MRRHAYREKGQGRRIICICLYLRHNRRIEIFSMIQKTSTFVNLTRGQARALPVILSARTVEEGCKNAGISKQTFYNWMKIEVFRDEYRRNHSRFVALALRDDQGKRHRSG